MIIHAYKISDRLRGMKFLRIFFESISIKFTFFSLNFYSSHYKNETIWDYLKLTKNSIKEGVSELSRVHCNTLMVICIAYVPMYISVVLSRAHENNLRQLTHHISHSLLVYSVPRAAYFRMSYAEKKNLSYKLFNNIYQFLSRYRYQ